MAFGILIKKPKKNQPSRPTTKHGIYVRNWLTYLMRTCIANMERKAYYSSSNIISKMKLKINQSLVKELDKKLFILHNNEGTQVYNDFVYIVNNVAHSVHP